MARNRSTGRYVLGHENQVSRATVVAIHLEDERTEQGFRTRRAFYGPPGALLALILLEKERFGATCSAGFLRRDRGRALGSDGQHCNDDRGCKCPSHSLSP